MDDAKKELNELKAELDVMINELEVLIDSNQKINKETFKVFKNLINKITVSQEKIRYVFWEKMSLLRVTRLKEKRRIKNIDNELENWKNLKINSEKMIMALNERKNRIKKEIDENEKNPEKIATSKGQNKQNLENTKKRNEEIDIELIDAENKYNLVNNNLKEIQEKLSSLREDKARKEATIEGIENRKKDLFIQ